MWNVCFCNTDVNLFSPSSNYSINQDIRQLFNMLKPTNVLFCIEGKPKGIAKTKHHFSMHSKNGCTLSPMKHATPWNSLCVVSAFLNQDIMFLSQSDVTDVLNNKFCTYLYVENFTINPFFWKHFFKVKINWLHIPFSNITLT